MATELRVGRCASDERAAEDEATESVDIVRTRSTMGVCGSTGSVAAECVEDVEGRRKSALEKCEPGDDVWEVWTVRMLVGEVDVARPGGGDEESCACAASDETLSGARCPWPKDCPRMSGCGRSA
jgi:hypothetical protein